MSRRSFLARGFLARGFLARSFLPRDFLPSDVFRGTVIAAVVMSVIQVGLGRRLWCECGGRSLFDLLACILGLVTALKLSWKASVALFLVTELVLLVTTRDCLILNVVMLIYPIDGLQKWQMGSFDLVVGSAG